MDRAAWASVADRGVEGRGARALAGDRAVAGADRLRMTIWCSRPMRIARWPILLRAIACMWAIAGIARARSLGRARIWRCSMRSRWRARWRRRAISTPRLANMRVCGRCIFGSIKLASFLFTPAYQSDSAAFALAARLDHVADCHECRRRRRCWRRWWRAKSARR